MPAIACQRVSRDLSKRAGEIFQIALDVVAVVAVTVVAVAAVAVVVAVVEVISVVAFDWLRKRAASAAIQRFNGGQRK